MNAGLCKVSLQRVGLAQGETGDSCVKAFAACVHHLISPMHRAKGSGQWTAGGILERLSRSEHGLFANHSWTTYFFHVPSGIGNNPMPTQQLNSLRAFVRDPHGVEEKPLVLVRSGAARVIPRLHVNPNPLGHSFGSEHSGPPLD